MGRRALHFVFKIGDRKKTIDFFKNILGMTILRHEEFSEGCKAYCNGPYDGKWSKTMVGYGPEDNHFVMELTYNYGIGTYKMGNDYQCIHIHSSEVYDRIKSGAWPISTCTADSLDVQMPGGYRFKIHNCPPQGDPVKMVDLSSSSLARSVDYWSQKCGMQVQYSSKSEAVLCFGENQCRLKLVAIPESVDHASAFGRIAFACPKDELSGLQQVMDETGETILKRLVSLDTPGKATVQVVILADPDGHEICFVGDEAFRQLSQVDPCADFLLEQAMSADKSEDWFQKRGGKPVQ